MCRKVMIHDLRLPLCLQEWYTITHKMIAELNLLLFSNDIRSFLHCDNRTELFLELLGLGKKCEQRITESLTESLTELFWELYSSIWVEELSNRNCFGINSVIFSCAMVHATILFWGVHFQKN